jgi:SAM-dependent methyltransferase
MSPTSALTETHLAPLCSEQSQSLELVYLMERDRLMTRAMGGVLPELPTDAFVKGARMLDLACGPAGWAVEAAFQFPGVQVCGVDKQPDMVRYARARANPKLARKRSAPFRARGVH